MLNKTIILILISIILIGNVNAEYSYTNNGYFLNQGNGSNLTQDYLKNINNMTNITNINASNITIQKLAQGVQQEAIAIQFIMRLEKTIYTILKQIIGLPQ